MGSGRVLKNWSMDCVLDKSASRLHTPFPRTHLIQEMGSDTIIEFGKVFGHLISSTGSFKAIAWTEEEIIAQVRWRHWLVV